ncbi:Predicted CoA-binding protein [Pelagirhabdus alkalitolerans]|uniref:Predicted CoA-binding protein n=1 Tax=Pelagirhabdus alkalitolerans TaxID=1612202 RepID=A0A1G6H6U7_9BACI|nr:CoA-binding protein [Pelagirhabdus alkalitolerans]SDB89838.1 Predicted CoA-binding protein [Pelagirhabdus alkalitolerans]
MRYKHPSDKKLKEVLTEAKTIAVVGLSDKENRTSHQVSKVMQDAGYRIIPVNPNIESALGETAYSKLSEIEEKVDIVNVFRQSIYLYDVAKEAKDIGASVLWGQLDVIDKSVYKDFKDDMEIIMDECIKVAYHEVMK